MAKPISTIVGILFIIVGLTGFLAPNLLGTHLSFAHNMIHLFSGAISLYFGIGATLRGARYFCLVFGAIYLILGFAGFLIGTGSERILAVIPAVLVLGVMDHILHVILGTLYLIGGGTTPPAN
jgi:hypothetical protein